MGETEYVVDVEFDEPQRQSRWKTFFRLPLALPAITLLFALRVVLVLVAVFGWFTGLFLARMPHGLQRLGAYCVRYEAQTNAYLFLLTDRYPYTGPEVDAASPPAPEPEPEPIAP
jgi:hypothetical protein